MITLWADAEKMSINKLVTSNVESFFMDTIYLTFCSNRGKQKAGNEYPVEFSVIMTFY